MILYKTQLSVLEKDKNAHHHSWSILSKSDYKNTVR